MRSFTAILIILFLLGNILFADSKAVSAAQSAERVINVLENNTNQKHLTMDLINIARNGHLLNDEEKTKLKGLGFDFSDNLVVLASPAMQDNYDSEHFRVHYDTSGTNKVDIDYVETVANVFEEVYNHDINELGYTPPPSDGSHGGSGAYDIYIQSTNAYGWTMYIMPAVGDNPNSLAKENNAYASYITINSSYDGFPNTELENIQVTAAHEFFHAIQLGYDGDEELWMLEATAVWMEDENYDDVNDCYQYLIPWFEKPQLRLNTPDYELSIRDYGSFIFFKYIDEHLGGKNIIRKTWENSRIYDSTLDNYSIKCIDLALENEGHTFKKALNNMVIANLILSSDASAGNYAYEEADGYKNYQEESYYDTVGIELAIYDTLSFIKNMTTDIISYYQLQPYAAQYVKLETDIPVNIALEEPGDSDDIALDNLGIHSIVKTTNGSYLIDSGKTLNIDPGNDTDWIYIAVVSNDINTNSYYNYQLTFSNGVKEVIDHFTISRTYPNPFNSTVNIKLKITKAEIINISIYDLLGQKITTVSKDYLSEGTHEFYWDGTVNNGSPVSSGVYYISAKGANHQEWKKVTLIK